MATASESEQAVRNYLLFLEDPSKLVDPQEVRRLENLIGSTSDPLERLQSINRLRELRAGDGHAYRQAFCRHAKTWAEAHDIRPSSFLEIGVDEATLRSAGFSLRGIAGQERRTNRRRPIPARRHVRVEDIKEAVVNHTGHFTLAEVAAASGGSPMTVRKAIEELIAAGEVARLGPTPNWSQPGRAPIQYRRRSKRPRKRATT